MIRNNISNTLVADNMESLSVDEDTIADLSRERKHSVNRVHDMVRERKDSSVEDCKKFEVAKVKCLKEIYENFLIEEKQRQTVPNVLIGKKDVNIVRKTSYQEQSEVAGKTVKVVEKVKIVENKSSASRENSKNSVDETESKRSSNINKKDSLDLPENHSSSFRMNRESIKKQFEQGVEAAEKTRNQKQEQNITKDIGGIKRRTSELKDGIGKEEESSRLPNDDNGAEDQIVTSNPEEDDFDLDLSGMVMVVLFANPHNFEIRGCGCKGQTCK